MQRARHARAQHRGGPEVTPNCDGRGGARQIALLSRLAHVDAAGVDAVSALIQKYAADIALVEHEPLVAEVVIRTHTGLVIRTHTGLISQRR